MAWFHSSQEAGLPRWSHTTSDHRACRESNPKPAIPIEDQSHPQPHSSIPSYPTTSQEMQEPFHISSLSQHASPVHMSFVTLQEQRCVINWFLGWGSSQRECFHQDLIAKAAPGKVCSLLGHLNKLRVIDRPPNVFECQLRLWTQWFDTWTEEERNAFLHTLEEKDPTFVAQFYEGLASTAGKY